MAHSVSGYVLYVSMWFNTKFVRVPKKLAKYNRHFTKRPCLHSRQGRYCVFRCPKDGPRRDKMQIGSCLHCG